MRKQMLSHPQFYSRIKKRACICKPSSHFQGEFAPVGQGGSPLGGDPLRDGGRPPAAAVLGRSHKTKIPSRGRRSASGYARARNCVPADRCVRPRASLYGRPPATRMPARAHMYASGGWSNRNLDRYRNSLNSNEEAEKRRFRGKSVFSPQWFILRSLNG